METQKLRNKNGQINVVLQEKQTIRPRKKAERKVKKNPFSSIEQEFSSFIGMDNLKKTMKEIYATIMVNERRKEVGFKCSNQVLHMLFKGNPGTGKTTLARRLAKFYFDIGVLSKGQFVEAERADLVGEYIGQTAQKTRSIIQRAMGGILFIDEAYSLARGGEKDFGKEAIDTLVKQMEDKNGDFVLILAGYPSEMERFLLLNPGLKSRFPFILDFNDYSVRQLLDIAKQMVSLREYELTKEAEWKLEEHLYQKARMHERNFANARYIRNVIEHAIRRHAVRVMELEHYTPDDLRRLVDHDLSFKEK